jgi:hypothetical protein
VTLCKDYVRWFHDRTSGDWVTWEPGDWIEPGNFGWFNGELRFCYDPNQNVATALGIDVKVGPEKSIASRVYANEADFDLGIVGSAAAELPVAVAPGADISLKTRSDDCNLLSVSSATRAELMNTQQALEAIRQLVLTRQWPIDHYVVTSRVRCTQGFAIIARRSGREIRLKAKAEATLAGVADLADVSISPGFGNSSADRLVYSFASSSDGPFYSPIFEAPMGVARTWWARLLRMHKKGNLIVDASGHEWPLDGGPPWNLQHLPMEERTYQPDASGVVTADELMSIPIEDFFEKVGQLDDEHAPVEEAGGYEPPVAEDMAADDDQQAGSTALEMAVEEQ